MALLFPAILLFRHTLLWAISTLVLVGITFLCWRYRRANPETSLVLNLLSILAFTGGALLVSGTAGDNALVIPLFMILSILPFTGLISLRPLLGLGITLTTVLIVSVQTSTRHFISYVPGLVASLLGLLIAYVLYDYERIHASLSEAAVTDPTTGLGNFYSLKMDVRRYQALAQREDHALLLIRWCFENVKGLGHATSGLSVPFQFTHYLSQCIRQGDGLYYLGEREFISLHPKLETGADLATRVQQIYPGVQVTWARGESQALVEVLAHLKKASMPMTLAENKISRWLS
jgi:GGDEF domain-containing protein